MCEVCGLVIERPVRDAARWVEQIGAEDDFVPNPQHTDLLGVCGACHRAEPRHHLSSAKPSARPSVHCCPKENTT